MELEQQDVPSLGREFTFNDRHANPAKLGNPVDRNTELLPATC